MATFKRKLKVSKTDAYVLNVSSWLASEAITAFTVTPQSGLLSIGATSIDGGDLKFLATGITAGAEELHFEYTTATRSDCYVANLNVIDDC